MSAFGVTPERTSGVQHGRWVGALLLDASHIQGRAWPGIGEYSSPLLAFTRVSFLPLLGLLGVVHPTTSAADQRILAAL